MDNQFDVIVIGSGIGGLTSASLLSKLFGKRVLVLEQHFKPGGFTHIFKRKDWEWDVGIHYIGQMDSDSLPRKIIDFLTDGNLQWNKMIEPFEEFVYPNFRFEVHGKKEIYQQTLMEAFPKEKDNISEYFNDIEKMNKWFGYHITWKSLPKPLDSLPSPLSFSKHALITTKEYLDYRFRDERLKNLLVSRWGNYGLPPSYSAFLIHALIDVHYLEGGWYPNGGASMIAKSILPSIKKNQGDVLLSHRVDKILIENQKAIGVEVSLLQGDHVKEKKEFFADMIISNVGAYNTYLRLLPKEKLDVNLQKELQNIQSELKHFLSHSTSMLSLYLGLKEIPHFTNGRNYWIYRDWDHDKNFHQRNELIHGKPQMIYVSFPSIKNPMSVSPTAEIIAPIDYELFEKWKTQAWKNRDEDYQNLKNQIAHTLINFANEFIPNFSDIVEYYELATPLSNEFFSLHPKGIIYGLPCIPQRFKSKYLGPKSFLQNLFLTGADVGTPGFVGAMMGGLFAVAASMGMKNASQLLKTIMKKN
ncbi:MAG: NAD(P)/FAD-dependent oxidoreductase [Leptospiraceae bacterium]|nr:NAD(P)/FAD-dependent oxidoreductase [Leptospiraceae bacterium]MDW7974982.1 NAD(P)/FAD-dependent oxidoreductase [Leptospiraceae bacterium]